MDNYPEMADSLKSQDGYLKEMSSWSRDIAEKLAKENDIGPLCEEHWVIIDYIKDYYQKYQIGPSIVKISKRTGFSSKKICELFPCGVARGAYRLAGLPRPSGCT